MCVGLHVDYILFSDRFIFSAIPKLSTEDDKDSAKMNGNKERGSKSSSEQKSVSDKTDITTFIENKNCTATPESGSKKTEVTNGTSAKLGDGNETAKESLQSDELKNNNKNGYNNSSTIILDEQVLINNTRLVTL